MCNSLVSLRGRNHAAAYEVMCVWHVHDVAYVLMK